MINIMIADDDEELSQVTKSILSQNEDFNVVNQTYTGIDTINSYLALKPDILLLDIDMPKLNGIDVINFLCHHSFEEQSKCNILVVSAKLFEYPLKDAVKVFRVIEKPFDWDRFPQHIYDCYNFQKQKYHSPINQNELKSTLTTLKFELSHKGTKYLCEAISIVNKSEVSSFLIDDLYKKIAKNHSTTPHRVKWNIQNSINSSYKLCGVKKYKEIFEAYDERKPTPKYLICLFNHIAET